MMARRRRARLFIAVVAIWLNIQALTLSKPARAENKDITEAGDVVQLLLPMSAYLATWLKGDKEGAMQLSKAGLAAGLSTHIFKTAAERRRPDATDTRSFPSGHTTAAYVGAEFIRVRYGNKWGIPAHVAAGFVGYSRIQANKHFADDVLAGAGNALLWNWLFTTPSAASFDVQPMSLSDGFGIQVVQMLDSQIVQRPAAGGRPKWTFALEWGPVSQDRNLFESPADTGFLIDLATAETEIDFTSRIVMDHFFADRHEWQAYLAPMELIEFDPAEVLTEPAFFAGKTFLPTPGTTFSARYDFGELRLTYKYTAYRSPRWTLKFGGGLQLTMTQLEIQQFVGPPKDGLLVEEALAEELEANPVLSAQASLRFSDRWSVVLDFDGSGGKDEYLNSALFFVYEASPEWRFGFGGRYLSRDYSTREIHNKLRAGDVSFRVTRSFF